jgi:hypothetical protein
LDYSKLEKYKYSVEMSRIRRNKTILILVVFVLIFYLSIRSLSAIFKLNTSKENNSQPQVRIYCFILTAPKFFDTRARAINSTWARRCDGYSFISEYSNDTKGLPIAPIRNLSASYEYLTQKSTSALLYIYENFLNDYDWFFKADDDTYLFVENLKQFLEDKNASEPITFGYNFKVGISNEIFNPTMDSSLCLFQQDSDYSVDVLKNLSYFYNSL